MSTSSAAWVTGLKRSPRPRVNAIRPPATVSPAEIRPNSCDQLPRTIAAVQSDRAEGPGICVVVLDLNLTVSEANLSGETWCVLARSGDPRNRPPNSVNDPKNNDQGHAYGEEIPFAWVQDIACRATDRIGGDSLPALSASRNTHPAFLNLTRGG